MLRNATYFLKIESLSYICSNLIAFSGFHLRDFEGEQMRNILKSASRQMCVYTFIPNWTVRNRQRGCQSNAARDDIDINLKYGGTLVKKRITVMMKRSNNTPW